jgi:hypothetical protein
MNQVVASTPTALDGFETTDDEGSERLIKGEKIKFTNDCKWVVARSGEVISRDREFLVVEIRRVVQKWLPDQTNPAETHILNPGEPFPNLRERNDAAPRSEWRKKFERQVGPWQSAHVLYLIEQNDTLQTAAAYTWVAETDVIGASRAVSDLRERTTLTRRVRGRGNLFPRVRLSDTHMPTGYGGRQRPDLEIISYLPLGPEQETPAQIEHHEARREQDGRLHDRGERDNHREGARVERGVKLERLDRGGDKSTKRKDDLNDEIPW